jgi:hypothetical protein
MDIFHEMLGIDWQAEQLLPAPCSYLLDLQCSRDVCVVSCGSNMDYQMLEDT